MNWVLLIGSLVSVVFGGISTLFSFKASNTPPVTGTVSVISDHPAAQTVAAPPVIVAQKPATVKGIVSDVVNQPWTVWGLGFAALFSVPLIAQLRAGAHEAYTTGGDLVNAGMKASDMVNNADRYTGNKSRRK